MWIMPRWAALSRALMAKTNADWVVATSPVAAAVLTFLTKVLSPLRVLRLRARRLTVLRRSFLLDFVFAMID